MKRIAVIIAVTMILSACSPNNFLMDDEDLPTLNQDVSSEGTPSDDSKEKIINMRIAYDQSDTLNPFFVSSTTNNDILTLIYDPLIKLDRNFKAEPYLAESVELNGLKCRIEIKRDIKFTDGTGLISRDVAYSIDMARSEGSPYEYTLENIDSYAILDNYTIEITLKEQDIFFDNLLTFPIVKYKEPVKAREELLALKHTGTGRYILAGTQNKPALAVNDKHFSGVSSVQRIELVTLPSDNTPAYNLKVGVIDYMFSELNTPDLYSVSSSNILINMNNLVYMGINSNRSFFSNPSVRRAIELAIDRDDIVSRTYSNKATATYTPFNPSFWASSEVDAEMKNRRNVNIASEVLDVSGYNARDEELYRTIGGNRLTLRLIINSESEYKQQMAQQIKEYLRVVGIELLVEEYSFDIYKQMLLSGNFDLYIGEVKLHDNMDISNLLDPTKILGSGTPYDSKVRNAYKEFREGTITVEEFITIFDEEKPFIPVLYRRGMVAFSKDFSADIVATEQDIFYNIVNW